jgi:cytochrome c-type biogenesis protein CcmH
MMRTLLFSLLLVCGGTSYATPTENYRFSSAEDEVRYRALIAELRCLVCQNQNLADSDAELAQDLRRKTRDMINNGQTDAQIKAWMSDRYGDFVLYRPPFKPLTLMLWFGPALLLLIGLGVFISIARRQARLVRDTPNKDTENDE